MAQNPRSLANLKPFQPGHAPVPGAGRKRRPVSSAYAARLEMVLPEDVRKVLKLPAGSTWADGIALQQARMAIGMKASSTGAAKELREGVEGRAPMIQFNHLNNGPLTIEVEYAELSPEVLRRKEEYRRAVALSEQPLDVVPTDVVPTDVVPTDAPETPESE